MPGTVKNVTMTRALVAVAAALAFAPAAHAGGPHMLVGTVDQNVLQATDAQAKAKLDLAKEAGLGDAVRVAFLWARGRRVPEGDSITRLRKAVATAGTTTRALRAARRSENQRDTT